MKRSASCVPRLGAELPDRRSHLGQLIRLFKCRRRQNFGHAIVVGSREHDDRNLREHRVTELLTAKRPSVHHRHPQIEHDHGSAAAAAQVLERLETVGGRDRGESFELEKLRERTYDCGVIVDHENRCGHANRFGTSRSCPVEASPGARLRPWWSSFLSSSKAVSIPFAWEVLLRSGADCWSTFLPSQKGSRVNSRLTGWKPEGSNEREVETRYPDRRRRFATSVGDPVRGAFEERSAVFGRCRRRPP